MRKTRLLGFGVLALAMVMVFGLGSAGAAEKALIGYHIDYERLTTLGPPIGQGMNDYIKLWKQKNNGGLIDGVLSTARSAIGALSCGLSPTASRLRCPRSRACPW